MIVLIDSNDRDIIEKICTKNEYPFRFFTNEENPDAMQVEIEFSKGVDMSAKFAYHLGREVQTERFERMMKRIL